MELRSFLISSNWKISLWYVSVSRVYAMKEGRWRERDVTTVARTAVTRTARYPSNSYSSLSPKYKTPILLLEARPYGLKKKKFPPSFAAKYGLESESGQEDGSECCWMCFPGRILKKMTGIFNICPLPFLLPVIWNLDMMTQSLAIILWLWGWKPVLRMPQL